MRVVVIGAGFAGLCAARRLVESGVDDVIVLEARDRVGGRTRRGELAGVDIDLGGMWLGPTQTRLKALADHYGVAYYPTHLGGRNVVRVNGKEASGEGEDFEDVFTTADKLQYALMEQRLRRLSARLDVEAPWNHPRAAALDGQTVEYWMTRTVHSPTLRSFMRIVCLSLFCAEASQISMLFFLHYLRSGGGLDVLLSAAPGGAQNFLFKGGVHQIGRAMADELGPRLLLERPVTAIDWHDDGAVVRTPSGDHEADRVISTAPITLLSKIEFTPPLPQRRQRLQQRLEMGSAIKYWVAFERPFWRDQGFNGMIVRDDVPCSPCFDATQPGTDVGLIAGFFDADHAVNHGDAPMEERRRIVLRMLAEHFGPAALEPLDYVDVDWTATDWSNGCYGAFAPPGVYAGYAPHLRTPVGPIHWAGTETSPIWTGYIEGAIRSGESAADAVTAGSGAGPP